MTGSEPVGLDLRRGGSTQLAEIDRALAAAELLEVHEPLETSALGGLRDRRGHRTYRETRLAPGDAVTIVGRALPFSDLDDPDGADLGLGADRVARRPGGRRGPRRGTGDRAPGRRSDGRLGQRGHPGVRHRAAGLGAPRSTRPRMPLPLAGADEAARVQRTFDIAPEALVLAASPDVPLLIAHGVPGDVVERGQDRFTVGLLGAVLAIVSAMVVAIDLSGGFGR